MTPAQRARQAQDWEDHVDMMERLRDRDAATIQGFIATLHDIRALPEVRL